jgi:hypothetical protein
MKTRYIRRTIAATAIALCATTTVVACGSDDSTGDGGVGAATGDDARADSSDGGNDGEVSSANDVSIAGVDPSTYGDVHSSGDEVEITAGRAYEYDDGRMEFAKDAVKYGVTVGNLRTIDIMSEADPEAPADHPDAQSHKTAEIVCFDMKTRIISDPERKTSASSQSVNPIASILRDGKINGDNPSKVYNKLVRPGEDRVLEDTSVPETIDNEAEKSFTETHCYNPGIADKEVESVPDDFDGLVVAIDTYMAGSGDDFWADPMDARWKLELKS